MAQCLRSIDMTTGWEWSNASRSSRGAVLGFTGDHLGPSERRCYVSIHCTRFSDDDEGQSVTMPPMTPGLAAVPCLIRKVPPRSTALSKKPFISSQILANSGLKECMSLVDRLNQGQGLLCVGRPQFKPQLGQDARVKSHV